MVTQMRLPIARRRVLFVALALCAMAAGVSAQAQSTVFRFDDLDLRDPHVFVDAFGSCLDVTDSVSFGLPSLNDELQDSIRNDRDGDGLLDQSTLIEFLPLDRTLALNLMDAGSADCTAPLASTICSDITASFIAGDAALSTSTTCLQPVAGSVVHVYAPATASAAAPCFASPAGTLAIDFGGIV